MSDQRPDTGDDDLTLDNASDHSAPTEPEGNGAVESTAEGDSETTGAEGVDADAEGLDANAEGLEGDAAAVAGAAWTTTPVAADPEATEAALAALAAKPEVTLEPPSEPPVPAPVDGDELPDEGTPVLLVGGILVGAFVVALAIVLILFRPFDSVDVDLTPSPSPAVSVVPSPSAFASVAMPDFFGLTVAEAEDVAVENDLVVRLTPTETDEAEPDTVLSQDPPPGETVEPGSTVVLEVAVAVPTVAVPDVAGMSEEDAIEALEEAGFAVGDTTLQYSNDVRSGHVIGTDPETDSELARGSVIDLIVSLGPETVAVPDIVGRREAAAVSALAAAGLAAGAVTESNDPSVPAGRVISSDPAAATEVAPGSSVDYVLSLGPETVAVPDVVGLPEDEAVDELLDAGLAAGAVTEINNPTVPPGAVISQDPAPDTEVPLGSSVDYVLSLGPETVAVPDLAGLPEEEAVEALAAAGLAAGAATEANSDTVPAGDVVSQDPAPDAEVPLGSSVSYVVSLGPATVAVPDLVGLTEEEAVEEVTDAGLAVGTATEANSDTVPAGSVISSDPAADAEVPLGSSVDYVLSLGVQQVEVPDLSGPAADAPDLITGAGLAVGEASEAYSDSVPAGDVVSQDPAAGQTVDVGTAVDYVESLGVQTVAVPDLAGLPEEEAVEALAAAGLAVGEASEAYSDSVPAGDVVSQDPAPDAEVPLGSSVSYVVSLGPATVAVPDLVGLTEEEAVEEVTDAGLAVGTATEANSDTVPAGSVISSNPAADAEVPLGSSVDYVLSLGVQQVEVPDLSGPAADAPDLITGAGLAVGEASEAYSDSVPAGDVVSQDPAAGQTVDVGTAVDYVESLGVQTVAVPDLAGLPEEEAVEALAAAGLAAGAATEANSDSVPAGDVVSQDPAPDAEVPLGSSVSYVVSLGPATVAVPDLVGLTEEEAVEEVTDAGLAVGTATEANSDTVPAGSVISSDPAADAEVPLGSSVDYVLSLGVQQVEVPDLSGPAADAPDLITGAGLAVGEASEAYSDSVPAGDVVSQDPAAGQTVDVGTAVDYVESLGVQTVAVPDLSGPAADAPDLIAAAGLAVGEASEAYSDSVPAGDVVSQDPAPDAEVPLGSSVSYVVSLGPATVAVPDLVGLTEEEAVEEVTDAGLAVGTATEANSDTVPAGSVISSDPAADAEVPLGSSVDYVLSLGVQQVEVPDLSGPAADAPDLITGAGLAVGEASEAYSDSVPAGDVVSQDPAAGQTVDVGTAVDYVESLGVQTVAVPDLSGPAADAPDLIAAAGLAVGEASEAYSDSVPAGDVVSQDPAPDAEVPLGSSVSYVVSLGPATVAVPDLVGLTEEEAVEEVTDAGLAVGTATEANSDTVPAGSVISSDPAADAEVPLGSSVDYVLSLGVQQVEVPDLSGPAADAPDLITGAGLAVGEASEAYSDSVPAGDVVSQDPAAGQTVDVGTAVDYVESLGPTPFVSVPPVRDLPASDAVAAIEAAGLVVGETIQQTHENVAAGDAIKTEPAADAEAPQGSPVALYISTGSRFRTIPDVSGQPAADAQAAIQAEDLAVTVDERTNAKTPAGDAVKTEPAAGTVVEAGSEVVLVVSRGPKQVTVPNVVGIPRPDARSTIIDAELRVGDVVEVEGPAPVNSVVSQDPAPDAVVDKGSAVNLTVSSGPPTVTIPEVKGQAAGEAQTTLQDLGLVVGTEERTSASVAVGDAVRTEPAAGSDVAVGTEVLLVVSKGPKPVLVPDVVGSRKGAASTTLTAAGLLVGAEDVVEDDAPINTVLAQDPAAGTEVPGGTSVNLTLSSGPTTVTIPEVKGRSAADASSALTDLGLVVSSQERTNATVAAGDAVKTEPAAGSEVAVGTEVLLTISKGPKPVVVPDVVNTKRGPAQTTIADAGLAVGAIDMVDADASRNTVLAQDPAAGSEVPAGTSVNLTVSSGPALVTIPEVRDQAAADAQATLQGLGLVVNPDERTNAAIAAGNAVRTEPAAGESVDVGSEVTLIVSRGPRMVTVPSIVGLSRTEADDAITTADLTIGEATVVDDDAPRNTVLAQDPAADSEVAVGTAVSYTVSTGPADVTIPDVRGTPAAEAQAMLEDEGLVVDVDERTNAKIAAGDAVKTEPAAGESVEVGSEVLLIVSRGPKQVTVPPIVGLTEADAQVALSDAEVAAGERTEANDESVPAGSVVSQEPAAGTTVDKDAPVSYVVSLGPTVTSLGAGGDLEAPDVVSALDAVASTVPAERELDLAPTPYDGVSGQQQAQALAERASILHDLSSISAEERALKRLGLLSSDDDLAALLDQLYGQPLPISYDAQGDRQLVLSSLEDLDASQRAESAREFGRATTNQRFGAGAARADVSNQDAALAAYALEQGDGTAVMLDWSAENGNSDATNEVIVPGDDGVFASMPLLLQREYSLPFLEGRIFVDRLRESGGWDTVNGAWTQLPESTEQILHPRLYPGERPRTVDMAGIANRLGNGWNVRWQQTMGELRTAVWLADGQAGEQSGPRAAVKLPRANAAAGWGGDTLVSLGGPGDGEWAIVWQTRWDSEQDVGQFVNAAGPVLAGLDNAGVVLTEDVSAGVPNPALVLIADSDSTLTSVAESLGLTLPPGE